MKPTSIFQLTLMTRRRPSEPSANFRQGIPLSALWLGIFISVLFLFPCLSLGSILQFDQIRDASGNVIPAVSGNGVEADYGDRITDSVMNVAGGQFTYGNAGEGFTPNIEVDFFTGTGQASIWQQQYGDLTNVIIGNNNSLSLGVRLTADLGFEALLYGFDLAGWPQADYTIRSVQVLSGTTPLFLQNDVLVEGNATGPSHTAFEFTTPLSGQELLIFIDYGNLPGSQQDNIGFDNLRFGQTPPPSPPATEVPEPSTLFLTGFGILLVIALRGRNGVHHWAKPQLRFRGALIGF